MLLRSFYNANVTLIQNRTRTIPKYYPSKQNYVPVLRTKIDAINLNKIEKILIQECMKNNSRTIYLKLQG